MAGLVDGSKASDRQTDRQTAIRILMQIGDKELGRRRLFSSNIGLAEYTEKCAIADQSHEFLTMYFVCIRQFSIKCYLFMLGETCYCTQ